MMSVDRDKRTWRRGVEGSSEAMISFGRLARSFANDVARRFIRAALFRAFMEQLCCSERGTKDGGGGDRAEVG